MHALPESEPQPTSRPELFTLTFWLITIARVVRGAAVGGTAAFGAGAFDTIAALPWQGFLTGAAVGAIMSLLASLGTMFIPENAAGSAMARFAGRGE